MTLKKCTLRQLDDTFWRVDYGTATRILRSDSSGRFWYEDHGGAARWPSLDDALAAHGLTRHDPTPETAEEVLRANAKIHPGYGDEHVVSGFTRDHAREILDVLDAARADRDTHKTAADVYLERLRGAHKEIDRLGESLCEQQAVSAEAVLAPVRVATLSIQRSRDQHAERKERLVREDTLDAAGSHQTQEVVLSKVLVDLRAAIAEAEKIGRGQ